jgi:NADH-quinone oxidoreductase subunit G
MSETPTAEKTTVTITVDGRQLEAQPGELVIATAQRHGTFIPRFCYHERMRPVGMCRMCLVDVDTGRGPALAVSCMTHVAEGMKVETASDRVRKAQEGVLEFLLINHPLDCPVCDKGGECPLQDQTLSHGPGESRFVEEKRHFAKPVPISALVLLDRERCILCDRCTRFAKEVAGDPLISFNRRGNETQIRTFPDSPFASYFSGNTVQICPVGALTSTPYRFRARPWDVEVVESTCTTCAVGCRMTVESSRDVVIRYQGIDSEPVNWGWLCDRGRFNYESLTSPERVATPLLRREGELVEASWAEATIAAADAIRAALDAGGPAAVAVLGGGRGTNEDAYAWAKLAKAVIGTDNVDAQLGDGLPPEVLYGLPRATIAEACAATTVVLLGPDLKEELPVLFLRLRDAAESRTVRLLEIGPRHSGLTRYAWRFLPTVPGHEVTVARALGGGGSAAPGIDDADLAAAREQLGRGDVVVVVGRSNLAADAKAVADAAAALHLALPAARFLPVPRRGNVHGALDMGLAPGLLPGRASLDEASAELTAAWGRRPAERGLDAVAILEAAAAGRVRCLVLLGADPLADVPDGDLARRALASVPCIVAVDTHLTGSSRLAQVVLPAAAFAEKSGTTTNLEGRVTVVRQKVTGPGTAQPDWIIAVELADRLGVDLGFESVASVLDEIVRVSPPHSGLDAASLMAHPDGVVVERAVASFSLPDSGTEPTAPNSYDFRLVVTRTMYDAAVATATSTTLAPLAGSARAHLHPLDLDRLGLGSPAPVTLTTARASVALDAVADPSVRRGSVWVPFNQPGSAVRDLIDVGAAAVDVRIQGVER